MKKIFIISFLCVLLNNVCGQTNEFNVDKISTYAYGNENVDFKISLVNGELQFEKIIDSLNLSKDELFSRVISYFALSYNNSQNVIQQQDKENGRIIGKGIFSGFSISKEKAGSSLVPITVFYKYSAKHTLIIDIKNGKIRYKLTIPDYIVDVTASTDCYVVGVSTRAISRCAPIYKDYSEFEKAKAGKTIIKNYVDARINSEQEAFIKLCEKCRKNIIDFETSVKTQINNNTDW